MLKSVLSTLLILLISLSLTGAQDDLPLEATFIPVQSLIRFDYPANWIAREEGRVAIIARDEIAFTLELGAPVPAGQVQILLVYLSPQERQAANIRGENPVAILQSVIEQSGIADSFEPGRIFEYNHHLTARADFHAEDFAGTALVMQMDDDAVVLVQALTSPSDFDQVEQTTSAIARTIALDTMLEHILAIPDVEYPQAFIPEKTRFSFDYPDAWTVREANDNTSVLVEDATQTQIALQFFPYPDLQRQGIPIDDVTAILQEEHNRSGRPTAFGDVRRLIFDAQTYAYANIEGEGFAGLSVARDVDGIGVLWVSTLAAGETLSEDLSRLTWALLRSTYQPDEIALDLRYINPRYQFEFFYPEGFFTREASTKSLLLGSSQAMIDEIPDPALLSGDVQLLIEYVTPEEFSAAGGITLNSQLLLRSLVAQLPNRDDYKNWREVNFGILSYTQVDFSTGGYSGTALLSKLGDDGAVWIQLRTASGELAQWEAIALEIARSAHIVSIRDVELDTLEYSVYNLLDAQATPLPTPTLAPDAPPRLDDVLATVLSTPIAPTIRQLSPELPSLDKTYTANISHLQVNYGADWYVQEILPENDNVPLWENTIRLSNIANVLLQTSDQVKEGQVKITAQYTRYEEFHQLGFRGATILDVSREIVASFPPERNGTPEVYTVNGMLMVFIPIHGNDQEGMSILRELSPDGYITVQLTTFKGELETWLTTAIAIAQSATLNPH